MLETKTVAIFTILVALSSSHQYDPDVVEWFPHQYDCSKFMISFHGNEIEKSCAPNLHFNSETLKCDFPENLNCNNLCPLEDDLNNPVFYPDRSDCQKYFVCFNGSPINRSCSDGLWWDVKNAWCTVEDEVTCDGQTTNEPKPELPTITEEPTTTRSLTTATEVPTTSEVPTTLEVPTTSEVGTTTESLPTVPTRPPNLSTCNVVRHLSDPENGAYLKSLCAIHSGLTYQQSESACRDRNMELFVIDNSAVKQALFKATTEFHNTRSALWFINGKLESNGKWFTFSPERQSIFEGIDWTVTGRKSGKCLGYTMHHGPYKAMGTNCNGKPFPLCQFLDESQLVVATTKKSLSIISARPPNLSTCNVVRHLSDPENGAYLKSLCTIHSGLTYQQSESACRDRNMELFVIDNSAVQQALFKATTEFYNSKSALWFINGKLESNGKWFTFSPERRSIFEGIDWTVTGRKSGYCLGYTMHHGPYKAMGTNCNGKPWPICQFFNI